MHIPVLLNEVIRMIDPQPGALIVDGTMNGGGYAREILSRLNNTGTFLGIDWDSSMIVSAKEWLEEKNGARIILRKENFARIPELLLQEKLGLVDGLVLDLGFSSTQLMSGRGFSFAKSAYEEPLLMTYSDTETPAREILQQLSEDELAHMFKTFGEERYARRIAESIKKSVKPFMTVGALVEAIETAVPRGYGNQRLNPATRTFMALRIYANHELQNLETLLKALPAIVRPGGKVAIVSFHSLEDRIVKNYFRDFAHQKLFERMTKKPLTASDDEVAHNPRARSAKLRSVQKI